MAAVLELPAGGPPGARGLIGGDAFGGLHPGFFVEADHDPGGVGGRGGLDEPVLDVGGPGLELRIVGAIHPLRDAVRVELDRLEKAPDGGRVDRRRPPALHDHVGQLAMGPVGNRPATVLGALGGHGEHVDPELGREAVRPPVPRRVREHRGDRALGPAVALLGEPRAPLRRGVPVDTQLVRDRSIGLACRREQDALRPLDKAMLAAGACHQLLKRDSVGRRQWSAHLGDARNGASPSVSQRSLTHIEGNVQCILVNNSLQTTYLKNPVSLTGSRKCTRTSAVRY